MKSSIIEGSCEMTICPLRREATSICRTTFGMIAKLMFATLTVIVAGGCAGNMQAIIRGEGTPVVFSFEQGFSSDFYSAEIDGERFTGRAVMADSSSAFSSLYGAGVYLSGSSYVTTGNFKATLLGDRGSTLRCLMQYAVVKASLLREVLVNVSIVMGVTLILFGKRKKISPYLFKTKLGWGSSKHPLARVLSPTPPQESICGFPLSRE